jgi:hypothetical protein
LVIDGDGVCKDQSGGERYDEGIQIPHPVAARPEESAAGMSAT